MDEIGENMSSEESNRVDTPSVVKKPKKRSLVERELETNLTTWITSPVTTDGLSTSRYGRSRRLKTEYEFNETRKVDLKSPKDITPGKMQSAAYKMHASNSPCKKEVKTESYLDNQVDNIYQENISLSRFSVEATSPSPAKKFPKVYIRKDLIQNREVEEPIMLIKNLFSPTKSSKTPNSIIELSSEKKAKQNGHIDNTSVVKTLDFDGKKKVQIDPKVAPVPKNELFEFEAKCTYQVGDIAWARMGTFPFWPCIVTREPSSDMFVKKKMFGRVEHDIIHVTFLGDNGRRSWIVDNMLQQYQGLQHFEETRDKFTNEDKKKDPKLYAAYFISEKKQPLWNNSVEEADTLMREPKRLRVDIFHDILWKSRTCKRQKSGKITRTDSDVSLSESLYDSLFSEDDKSDDAEKSKSRPRNKSFDVSEVVTACLDNMAAKTGITKIQRQSHMDRWLQKAKSKTPEKISKLQIPQKVERKVCDKSKNKTSPAATQSSYKLRKSNDSQSTLFNSKNNSSEEDTKNGRSNKTRTKKMKTEKNEIVEKVESQTNTTQTNAVIVIDDDSCNSLDKKVSTQESYNSLEENKDVTNVKLNRELNDTDEKRNQDSSINHKIVPEMEATQESAIGQVNDVTDVKLNKYIDKVEKIDQDSLLRDAITKASDDLAPQVKTTEDSVISKANEVSHVINEELISHKFFESDIVENMDQDSLINDATSEISNENIPGVGTQKSDNFVDSNKEPNPDVEVNQNSMEVDEHLDIAANLENLKADSEIVSRESVQAIEVKLSENSYQNEICMKVEKAGMKDKHGATNETSVTEKKNDDTLNLQAVEEKQESSIRPEKSKENKTGNNIFLEITNSDIVNISATQLERNPINKDTNDKSNKTEETDTSYGKITKGEHKVTEQGSEETFIFKDSYNNNGDIDVDSKRRNTKYEAIDDNLPENVEKDILNESGNSESILCFDNDKGKNDFRTSLESDNFISTIENTQTTTYHANEKFEKLAKRPDLDEEKKKEGSERLVRTNAESPTFTQYLDSQITDENNTDTELETNTKSTNFYKVDDDDKLTNVLENRNHVESPTFTQLLESEEFFRDVNEVCDAKEKSLNLSSADIEKLINEPDFTQQSKLQNNEQINSKIYDKITKPSSGDKMPVNIQNGQTKLKIQINDIHADSKISEDNSNKIYNKNNDKLNQLVSDKVQYKSLNHDKRTVNKTKGQDDETCDDDDDDVESEDEPSPEYESLDEDITEDFRKHLQSIENNIKDQKDEEQIVKICNEIAEKAKLSPTKYVDLTCDTKPLERIKAEKEESSKLVTDLTIKQQEIKKTVENDANRFTENLNEVSESPIHHKDIELSPTNLVPLKDNTRIHEKQKEDITIIMNGNATEREMIKHTTRKFPSLSLKTKDLSPVKKESKQRNREPKVVISPLKFDTNLKITNKFIMDNKSCRKKLSLKRHSPKSEKTKTNSPERIQTENNIDEIKDLEVEPLVKKEVTEDNTQKLDKESAFDKNIIEPVKLNGYHKDIDSKFTNIQDLNDDKDFDIDAISINSEDSVVSLPQDIPRRNLRSRPERTLENALKSPEFLNYLELKQDVLMDEHPELNDKEILSYVYKTWQYEEDLKSDVKKIDDAHHSGLVKGIRQDTPSRKKSKKSQPKHTIENYLRDKYDKCSKTIDFESSENVTISDEIVKQDTSIVTNEIQKIKDEDDSNKNHGRNKIKGQNNSNNIQNGDITDTTTNTYIIDKKNRKDQTESKDKSVIKDQSDSTGKVDNIVKNDNRTKLNEAISNGNSILPPSIDFTDDDVVLVKDKYKDLETVIIKAEESSRKSLRNRTGTPKTLENSVKTVKEEFDNESIDSDNSEINLRQLRSKVLKEKVNENKNDSHEVQELQDSVKCEADDDTASDNETLLIKKKKDKTTTKSIEDPEFIKYLELRQDAIMDENPQLTGDEIVNYLHKTWLYEESTKSDIKKNDELEQANLVKGLSSNEAQPRKVKRKPKIEKNTEDTVSKEKPRRKVGQPLYNEEFYSDIEEELEVFEIFKHKKTPITVVSKTEEKSPKNTSTDVEIIETKSKDVKELTINDEQAIIDEIELYFTELAKPKPNVFKGLIRERVCDICEREGSLIKCKSCHGMFHTDCVKKQQQEIIEIESLPPRGRKKKRKLGRKPKSLDSENSEDKSQDASMDMSVEELILPPEISTFDADTFEKQLEAKMKKILENAESNYDSYSSDDGIDWDGTVAGKCEIVDVKLKRRTPPIDFSDFRCNNCLKHDTPICYVCRSAISKTEKKMRQKCIVGQCNKYYHLECLDHWPQTQFNSGETSRNNKKNNEYSETLTCPRHVCHTCVSDDPRGCKTRFSADKLAKCVRCPATYHSFNKCLPAGTQVLTASQIICPRHYEQKPGKVSCHVNTGWCFICAEGGSLICCEYCPTSFHAECLNIKPPEGNYMCEDCETGRLPLYGEMVWVKLGHYRWWPGIILHPSEIPENLFLMKHGIGEFVVRFFGQYDHYWVNRGRVFPYQEGDSGRISSQRSKIDAAFTMAIEHAQRAYEILKNADKSNDEESQDIASSLLPPHYVKLKSNKPSGALCGRRMEDPSLSLTACECSPTEPDPCGPYSHCLNRMLLTECGPTCRTGDRCNNRAFEKRLYPKLVPYRTPHRGWGLKTLEDIKAGQFVIEYVGELIDEEEFRRRMRRKHEIRDENYYFLTLDKERMIDAGPKGNLARFMNHCCEPNCETQKWTVLGDVRVGLFAIDDIPANTEVTFNYKLECDGIEKKRCLCGAKRCSGYIGAKLKQDESQSKKGKNGKVKRTYNKKKKAEDSPSTSKSKPRRSLGRPPKPKELTEIEKDLLIINTAANEISGDDNSRRKSEEDKNQMTLKRKRNSMSTEEVSNQEPSVKKVKYDNEKPLEVGD